ncbi:MAG: hypothetical protein ABSE57_17370 [Bryobacteraceae bacterium]
MLAGTSRSIAVARLSARDWTEPWEGFARDTAAGAWAKNGDKIWARRRGGLTLETPVRTVETPTKPER